MTFIDTGLTVTNYVPQLLVAFGVLSDNVDHIDVENATTDCNETYLMLQRSVYSRDCLAALTHFNRTHRQPRTCRGHKCAPLWASNVFGPEILYEVVFCLTLFHFGIDTTLRTIDHNILVNAVVICQH